MSDSEVGDLVDQRINVGLALIDWDQSEKSYYLLSVTWARNLLVEFDYIVISTSLLDKSV